jgi:hypothetical protein
VATERVISIVNPAARHMHKTVHQRQDGFKGHVAMNPYRAVHRGGADRSAGEDNHDVIVGLSLLDKAVQAACWICFGLAGGNDFWCLWSFGVPLGDGGR